MMDSSMVIARVRSDIASLGMDELDDYGVSISGKNLPFDVQSVIFDVIDERREELIKSDHIFVVNSEIRTGETFESIGE